MSAVAGVINGMTQSASTAVPPDLPKEDPPPVYFDHGTCINSCGGGSYGGTGYKLLEFRIAIVVGSTAQYPASPATFNEHQCDGDNTSVYIDWAASPQHVLGGRFYFDEAGKNCSKDPPPSEPP